MDLRAMLSSGTNQVVPMPSLHQPERGDNESQQQYRERRRAAKQAVARITGKHARGGIGSRQKLRDSMRASGTMGRRTRAYVALMAAWAAKRVPKWEGRRDEFGAYTVVGGKYNETPRRKWLAGVSERRGF